ncbi:sporulation protein YpjB [Priestia koreensis]|uniref:sporulation protein YpjB n=1 Tax=Priestia koreensis TaxID=284581 RepID=UPI0028F746FE|nr:sporulation protein YpjB [Priestia koreensis]
MRVLLIGLLCFFMMHQTAFAKENEYWKDLNLLSDEALELVKQDQLTEAEKMLTQFSDQFVQLNIQALHITMDDLRVLTVSHEEAIQSLTATLPLDVKVRKVMQFRLLVDALQSEHQPLWTEMEGPIMTTFKQLKTTAAQGQKDLFQQQLTQFLNQYETIEPSVKVDIKSEFVQKMNAHLNELDAQATDEAAQMKQLNEMEKDLKELFQNVKDNGVDSSLIWMMVTTGSIIILTLSYVGWRKYNGNNIITHHPQEL